MEDSGQIINFASKCCNPHRSKQKAHKMTPEERQSMKQFEARVRHVLAQYSVLKQENEDLYTEIEKKMRKSKG